MTAFTPAAAVNVPQHDPHHPKSKAGQAFLRYYRPVYRAFGFSKGYNFPFYLISVGGLFAFILARLQFLDIDNFISQTAMAGEAFWIGQGYRRAAITVHLTGVLVGGLLAVMQFTPIIRHKFLWFHRICGYLAILLFLAGNAGAFIIMDHSIGGSAAMVTWFALLGVITTIGIVNAYVNIKRLQIDQHRAWMIRTWAWAGCIISLRLLMFAGEHVIAVYKIVLYTPIRCDEIFWLYDNFGNATAQQQNPTSSIYPRCGPDAASNPAMVAVATSAPGPESYAASLRPNFLMGAWLALFIHALLAECYLWLTPAESYRLRVVSYERQVERGFRQRGQIKDAGISVSRIGDAPAWWSLPMDEYMALERQKKHAESEFDAEKQTSIPGGPKVLGSDTSDSGDESGSSTHEHAHTHETKASLRGRIG